MKLYYNKETKQFSLKETATSESVYETHQRIGEASGVDEFSCDFFRFQIHTNFYPKASHREYIWINVFVHDVLLLPISFAYDNSKFAKRLISRKQYGFGNDRFYKVGIRSPHTVVLCNLNQSWGTDYEYIWTMALAEARDICNNYQNWMLQETQKLISNIELIGPVQKPYYLSVLLELIDGWYKACPQINTLCQPVLNDYCFGKMSSLILQIKELDKSSTSQDRIQNFVRNGDLYWNYIKGCCVTLEIESKDS